MNENLCKNLGLYITKYESWDLFITLIRFYKSKNEDLMLLQNIPILILDKFI